MKHIYQAGNTNTKCTLLLLHGTGGTESDLLPLAQMIDPEANVLSVRGNVLENGMPRFFKRLAEGVFDEEDLIFRTKELNHFIHKMKKKHNLSRDELYAIGYSNGANIAASLLFHDEHSLKGAMLHHPMVPRRNIQLPDLSGKKVFIGAGKNDPLCHPEESQELNELLTHAGADVTLHWENHGHQLTKTEIEAAKQWYEMIK